MPCILLALQLLGCLGTGGTRVLTAEVSRGDFEVVLAIPGELEAVESLNVSSSTHSKVAWVIEEGTRVEEGDVLVRMDETELQQQLEEAEIQLETSVTKIEQREAQLEVTLGALTDAVVNSELALQRAKMRVTDSETVPRVERESARLDVKSSEIAVRASKSAMESSRLESEAEMELLHLDAERARRRLEKSTTALDEAVITAPGPGLVILRSSYNGTLKAGDQVWGGRTLVTLPDLSKMQIVAWVHEVDAPRVAVDQPVEVVIEAIPKPTHTGSVIKLADLAIQRREERQVKHLKVTISLDHTTEVMKPGMTVRAEVGVAHHEDVLSIPLEAVFYDEDDAFVHQGSGSRFSRTDVELGEANDTHVIVLDGLSEGDVVALLDPETAKTGASASPGRDGNDDES